MWHLTPSTGIVGPLIVSDTYTLMMMVMRMSRSQSSSDPAHSEARTQTGSSPATHPAWKQKDESYLEKHFSCLQSWICRKESLKWGRRKKIYNKCLAKQESSWHRAVFAKNPPGLIKSSGWMAQVFRAISDSHIDPEHALYIHSAPNHAPHISFLSRTLMGTQKPIIYFILFYHLHDW